MESRIRLDSVSYGYPGRAILDNVCLEVAGGDVLAIAGLSGNGKSTVLELCAGLRDPMNGHVLWDEIDLGEMSRSEMLDQRRRMGYLFQTHALIHNYPVFDNIALPLRRHFSMSDAEIRSRVMAHLERFALASVSAMLPDMLSFGQARCVALARALVAEPDLVLLDEPVSVLDPVTTDLIVNILQEYRLKKPVTYVIVSHNTFLIRQLGCKVKVLDQGRLLGMDDFGSAQHTDVPQIVSFLQGVR